MIHLAGFTCCLGGIALYLLSRNTGGVVKSITRVNHLKDLEQLVESKVFPLIIAVSGIVGSETPIKCEHSDILGVFLKKTAEQQVLSRNWRFSWVRKSTLMQPMTKEVPWFLDDGTGRVNVAVSQGEIGLALTVGSDVFEKAEPVSLVQGTLDYLKGLKILGVRRVEHVVPIGTPLTIVGEAVKDGMGNVRIQKPEQGPFYVSYVPLDQLISKLGEWRFKYASMGLTVVGVILLSKPVIKYILKKIEDTLERRRRQLLQKRVVDVPDLCVICHDQKYNTAFVQCGHMCCCLTCSLRLTTCPLCREQIQQVLKIYRH
ncbi:E3 ubiquitin-protein ligase SPL1 isoform X2 [Arabidopsis lyrata subsp. lyrata]|uniref:E3 ubiquitin-protein ligase SPL1 isoform X2 n=1 Tax=Arabidopsis lyrata subsp. lyrata TaxID=81972 RepID=UPI000A29BAD7|nr:E3 ubiquitin-protein ligase SPL1 isoform X2 [Arabidopsis lyrata subsp. lyrata]|eukprot:XP_020890317.1 E3 ubiquitin-protein ligase SPL1 isoform X2 [Arabidopsis lyrata subsp. lyrata]